MRIEILVVQRGFIVASTFTSNFYSHNFLNDPFCHSLDSEINIQTRVISSEFCSL